MTRGDVSSPSIARRVSCCAQGQGARVMALDIVHRGCNSATYVAQEDGKTIVGEMADVTGNLDRVQRMRQADINNGTLGRCVASIPLVQLAAWCNGLGLSIEEAVADDGILDRFLVEHGKLRVHKGWQ